MKSLKPSAKENRRYLIVKGKNLEKNIEKSILDFVGRLGLAKAGLKFIKKGKDSAIISMNRESVTSVRASFSVWPETLVVEKVSGTIKGLKK